jgi:hypothetical protein
MNTIKDLCLFIHKNKNDNNMFNREIQKKYDKNGGYEFYDLYFSFQQNTNTLYYAIVQHTNFKNYLNLRNQPVKKYTFRVLLPDIQISILLQLLKSTNPKNISYDDINKILTRMDAMWIAIYEQIHNRKMLTSCSEFHV